MQWNEKKISILTPIYNRPMFLDLLIHNINNQDYDKKKLEWVLLDDGSIPLSTNPLFKDIEKLVYPVKVKYVRENIKRILGDKRNHLVKLASNPIVINMDDDDTYLPTYISHSVEFLVTNKYSIVGSDAMMIYYPYKDDRTGLVKTHKKHMIHEATMCFTKKFFNSSLKFAKVGNAEGQLLFQGINDKYIGVTDIKKIMVCTSHKNNTYDKDEFLDKSKPVIVKNEYVLECYKLIKKILNIN